MIFEVQCSRNEALLPQITWHVTGIQLFYRAGTRTGFSVVTTDIPMGIFSSTGVVVGVPYRGHYLFWEMQLSTHVH